MSLETHYNVWYDFEGIQRSEIEYWQGVQVYLAYCKRNGITQDRMSKECSYDGMDVMTFYDGKKK
jgi:hypothetical protein